jgi:UDP-3-O-[3-hydroxymyristoyl] N-acetylglucosamine deacetylase
MQATLRSPFRFDGVGLHTGVQCVVDVRPGAPDSGLVFCVGSIRFPALADYVIETSRATVVGFAGASVSTTEHLLSALLGMGVSNAEIVVDGPEIPVRDGSAKEFADAIAAAGIEEQDRPRTTLTVETPMVFRDGEKMLALLPADEFRVRFVADFAAPIGAQYFSDAIDAGVYRDEIAAARTFGYLHEVEALRARGLAQGGTLDNALVFGPDGPLQPLRWPNEVVRHKVLDLIGDLALLGAYPQCEVLAIKSGHAMHARVTQAMRARLRETSTL